MPVCSDRRCDIACEAWGEPCELESLSCEECGRPLKMVAFANADRDGVIPRSSELRAAPPEPSAA